MNPSESLTEQRLYSLHTLDLILKGLQSFPLAYKSEVQRRLNNQNHELFKKKTFDMSLSIIQHRGLQRILKNPCSENYPQMNQFTHSFLNGNLETLKKKGGIEKLGVNFDDIKQISSFLEEDYVRSCNYKKNIGREMWNDHKDTLLLDIMSRKYPELLSTDTTQSKVRIKWKDVCREFKKQCKLNKESDDVMGKHCRERWINHLDPNMKRGNWTLEEDLQLLNNALIFKKRWCLISNELKSRSQHSLKNRFFHLMSTNLNITNKACLKRKNFSDDISRIIEKYRKMINEASTENPENVPLQTQTQEEEKSSDVPSIKEEMIKVEESKNLVKNETVETQQKMDGSFDMQNFQRNTELLQRNWMLNNQFQNMYQSPAFNMNAGLFWPPTLPFGLQMNGFIDPRMSLNHYY